MVLNMENRKRKFLTRFKKKRSVEYSPHDAICSVTRKSISYSFLDKSILDTAHVQ